MNYNFPTHIAAAGGLVYNNNGEVLLVHGIYRDAYEFPGGQVEIGENLEEAALREIFEETGVVASLRKLAGVYSSVKPSVWYDGVTPTPTKIIFDFICDYVSGEPRPSDETNEVIWVTPERAKGLITHPVYKTRLENLLNFKNEVFYAAYESRPFKLKYERKV